LPIFIVGMPRSGSTLVEQIIGSHALVHAGGELEIMNHITGMLPDILNVEEPYPECTRHIDEVSVRGLSTRYLEAMQDVARGVARVTDKMLKNIENIGLIAAMFPRARIIHCRRDARDVCTSIYCLEFAGTYPYAYNLANLGHYYCEYLRLMNHWRSVLPIPILEVDYEVLVGDLEGQTRRILDFCGLDWDDRCVEFHRLGRAVWTSSFLQVRQPVYRSAVGKWHRYEAYLGELRDALTTCDRTLRPSKRAPAAAAQDAGEQQSADLSL
jgi:hypothetical protein